MVIDATFWVAISFVIFIGVLIYLKIPQKINDLMNNMINAIKSEIEEAKIAIRNARKDANNEIKKSSDFSEDLKKNSELDIQEITDNNIKKADQIFEKKQQEIMTL